MSDIFFLFSESLIDFIEAEDIMAGLGGNLAAIAVIGIFVVGWAMPYWWAYLTFRHVLRKDYKAGKIRLVAAEA